MKEKVKIPVVCPILEAHERMARENREIFDSLGIYVVNLMSGPGAGKTTLLERTIERLKGDLKIAVIEGDIQSQEDAERIAGKGIPVVQINTGAACHLDGAMIRTALESLNLKGIDLLIIENVGNLVCPAEFDLGEHEKVMILSVAEGHDKPLKYPLMFQKSSVLIINKMDLLPYVECDVEKIRKFSLNLNPDQVVFPLSCKTGEGLDAWCDYLRSRVSSR
ncbi:hydrogenase nickel incorporation protein HypB [Thermodesulforhabdus norvegica]|uniref:Hydrogenase nickel incorporation protein HypB n=1 Tax=Thermodesulforhabdus norvegica TaxID=39841 RepID=A0A1I4V108_9BACT|nr:hydrogenase nickel incorporation protein HypB [Thermodesulforhabdus norvegica]SFM94690.1 hydrogenase nickel incorporation protein HypB [Thermodesulforhabdus norvegica]